MSKEKRDQLAVQADAHIREQEAIKQAAYNEGYARALEVAEAMMEAREDELKQRNARLLKEMEKVQWRMLFSVVVAGSVIGCGIILAVAIGLSRL
jgi:hypothetical protein